MKALKKIYKALELYELSTRDGKDKEYFGYTDERNQFAVIAYIINSESLKKSAINNLLSYVSDTTVTGKVLSTSNNYVVGLFDLINNVLVEGTLMFGTTKAILEDFNKKMSHSRYNGYFESNKDFSKGFEAEFSLENDEESIDFGDIGEITMKSSKVSTGSFEKFTIDDLRGNIENSREFLQSANNLTARDRIRKMGEITEAMETYTRELEKENVSDRVIDDILNLSFGGALNLQEKAIDLKTQKLKLQNISKSAKRDREAILQDVGS